MTDVLLIGREGPRSRAIASALGEVGARVARANDAIDALEHLETASVDCIVIRDDLPAFDADGLVAELERRGHDLPAVVDDGAHQEAVAERAHEAAVRRNLDDRRERRRRRRTVLTDLRADLDGCEDRDALESGVCSALSDSPAYRSAWVGRLEDGTATPAAAAGLELAHLREMSLDEETVTTAAVDDRSVSVAGDDPHVTVAVPLPSDLDGDDATGDDADRPHGVLHVNADRDDGLSDAERSALAELGAAIGRALDRTTDATGPDEDRIGVLGDTLAHELNNHLDVARVHLDLARERDDESHFEYVETALERMESLATDARALADDEADTEPVDIGDAADTAWEAVDGPDATLEVGDGTVEADGDLLALLLENLLRNAVQHGGEGVTVRVETTAAGFVVADDGPGIPEKDRERVFEWGHSGADESGVGLGIVALVADRHGWSVDIEESETGGARFRFA
jgi:signal transduction histidine kinase